VSSPLRNRLGRQLALFTLRTQEQDAGRVINLINL
jgi:hypothetical protein